MSSSDALHGTGTLYVSDLDGTLLGRDSRVSDTSAELLNDAIARHGALFTIATARTPATVDVLMSAVRTPLPLITMSGAALWDATHRRYAATRPIAPDVVRQVLDVLHRHSLLPFVYYRCGEHLEAHHAGRLSADERHFVDERADLPLKRFVLGDDACPEAAPGEALLVFVMSRNPGLDTAYRQLTALPCTVVCYHDTYDPAIGLLEIYAPNCSKAIAVAALAARLGVGRVVAFGDNINDLEMLRTATLPIAVGNAVPEVRAAASLVIGDNTTDAVARYIANDNNEPSL